MHLNLIALKVDKKKSKLSKKICRPVSTLPNVSKVYERCLYDQISNYFEDIFRSISGVLARVTVGDTAY